MSRRLALGAVVLGVLLLGCSLPPFDEELSLAMATAAKLEPVVQIGPIQAWHGDFEETESYFLPLKDTPGDRRGFLLSAGDYYLRARFLDGNTGSFLGENRLDSPAADPNRKTYTAVPLKGGDYLSLAVFDQVNPINSTLYMIDPTFATPGSSAATLKTALSVFPLAPLDRIVGVHLYPIDTALDRFSFFAVLTTAGHFGEVEADADPSKAGGVGTPGTLTRPDMPMPSLPTPGSGAFYYHRPVAPNTSYLSWYDSSTGDYRNYAWDDTLTVRELTGMNRRIDALLSSGELLSLSNGVCSVHDAGGNWKYSFPMGSLHFCFERYDATGAARLYFSLMYWSYGYQSGNDQMYITIYSLPTANLASLH